VRLKDLVEVRGVRSNPLVGLGLVVGLPGTGDSRQSLTTNKQVSHLLTRLGSRAGLSEVTTRNVAAVVVSAELPPFARVGDRVDIRISSVGDAASLEGGTLILTPLSAADDRVYAVAQGAVSMGTSMAGAAGGGGNGGGNSSLAPKTVALAKAATVEREFAASFVSAGTLELSLRNADFTTASRVAKVINETFGAFLADPVNAGLVKVRLPSSTRDNPSFTPVAFMATLEQLRVEPDTRAIVVINERTGTIISGASVTLSPVAISHGQLEILVGEEKVRVTQLPQSATVGELVRALGALGAGPKDLVSILQSLEAAKALKADLRIL
jgi:flagellar P-ring protein precursor FlgI